MKTHDVNEPREAWEIQEAVDDAVASERTTAEMLSAYVYEMTLGGKKVHGITAAGIAHLALEQRISIETCEREETEDTIAYTAWAIKLDTNQRNCGYFSQPRFMKGSIPDAYAGAKAMTKAKRNARKELLPAPLLAEAIDMFVAMANPTPDNQANRDAARRRCFAVYSEKVKPYLADQGIPEDAFWNAVRAGLKVASRAEMTMAQWNILTKRFHTPVSLPEIRTAAQAVAAAAKAAMPAEPATASEVPF